MAQIHGIEPEAPEPTSLSGHPTSSKRGLAAWLSYEFGQGPFFVTLGIFIFPVYVQRVLIGDNVLGQEYWGYITSVAAICLAMMSPLIGSMTDFAGARKPAMAAFVGLSLVATFALWFATPDFAYALPLAVVGYIIAAVTLELASVLHNAMLPTIVSERRIGALSGLGISFSNIGAIVSLGIWLAFFGDHPLIVAPLCVIWMVVFAAPLFALTPDVPRSDLTYRQAFRKGVRTLGGTFAKLSHYRNIALFLAARTVYYDGMLAIFIFVSVYVGGVYGWSSATITYYAVAALLAGAIGATAGGFLDNMIGSKWTIIVSIFFFMVGLALGLSITPEHIPWLPEAWQAAGMQVPFVAAAFSALGVSDMEGQTYAIVSLVGSAFLGPALGASRTMLTRISPPSMTAEFFGLYTLTGKVTSFIGPTAIAIMTGITNDQRAGMSIIILFLIVGMLMMLLVREERTEAAEH